MRSTLPTRSSRPAHRQARLGLLLLVLSVSPWVRAQSNPDFSGTWKLSGERSTPRRSGDATLRIQHHDPELTVDTTIVRGSGPARHAMQLYRTDGKVSVSRGADGDEFHTAAVWKDRSLIFTIEEHEDQHVLHSTEEWTLLENGAVLQRVREGAQPSSNGAGKQTLVYVRQRPTL